MIDSIEALLVYALAIYAVVTISNWLFGEVDGDLEPW